MGFFDMYRGDNLYYILFQYGLIGFTFLIVSQPALGIMAMITYISAYNWYMTKRRADKKEKHEGERHIDSKTLREKDYREDKVYSFTKYEQLELNTKIPTMIEETPEYKDALVFVLEREKKRASPEETGKREKREKKVKEEVPEAPEAIETPSEKMEPEEKVAEIKMAEKKELPPKLVESPKGDLKVEAAPKKDLTATTVIEPPRVEPIVEEKKEIKKEEKKEPKKDGKKDA